MLNKKAILILIVLILVVGVSVYFLVFRKTGEEPPVSKEKTLEEKIQDVTAPLGKGKPEASTETIKSLTAPQGSGGEVSQDILQKLTVPSK